MEVSKTIRRLREKKGFTQAEMATRLGTERSNYARLESRDTNLTVKQLAEIAEALEVSISEVLGIKDTNTKVSEDEVQNLRKKLKDTEDILKEKRRNIKLYKSFIEWTREMFVTQYALLGLSAAKELGIRDVKADDNDLISIEPYHLTEQELKEMGDYLFSLDNPLCLLSEFIAKSGFIDEKWFIDAFKRKSRERREKVAMAEVRNWVNSIFEFLKEE